MSSNSEYLDGIPTTPNTVSDSWQPAVEQIDTTKKGWNAVSLSNWDSGTTKPEVLTGSEIEAGGGVVRVTVDESILDDPGGIASGTLYLVVDFSGSDPEWYFTNDAPVWNASLNGYYEAASGSVNWRYTGHRCEWDGATAYTEKRKFIDNEDSGEFFRIGPDGTETDGTSLIAGGVDTDNQAIKTRYLSGTFASATQTTRAHGIASGTSKIIAVIGSYSNTQHYSFYSATSPERVDVRWDNTNLYLRTETAPQGKAYRLVVFYLP